MLQEMEIEQTEVLASDSAFGRSNTRFFVLGGNSDGADNAVDKIPPNHRPVSNTVTRRAGLIVSTGMIQIHHYQ